MFADMGGSLEAFYYGFGAEDLYMIVDLPDDAAAAAASMAVSSAGAIVARITVLITPETIDEATRRAVNYQASCRVALPRAHRLRIWKIALGLG